MSKNEMYGILDNDEQVLQMIAQILICTGHVEIKAAREVRIDDSVAYGYYVNGHFVYGFKQALCQAIQELGGRDFQKEK